MDQRQPKSPQGGGSAASEVYKGQALKIEGRQRGVAYVGTVARIWRQAIDRHRANPEHWQVDGAWQSALAAHAEGRQTTLGPYHRAWH